jgi:hypothetical protein
LSRHNTGDNFLKSDELSTGFDPAAKLLSATPAIAARPHTDFMPT